MALSIQKNSTAKSGQQYHANERVGREECGVQTTEIVSVNETVKTPAGEFKNCLKVEETTPLEPGVKEYKYYAPGVGLVQSNTLKLVSIVTPPA